MHLYLLIALLYAKRAFSDCATSPVVALPVTDVLLSNNHVFRGVPLSVGTPAQNISALPQVWFNDTWIYNDTATFCDWNTPTGCLTVRGGLYNTSSTSARPAASALAAGADPSDTERALGLHIWYNAWVNDDVRLDNITLPDFPIGLPGFDIFTPYVTQAQIGLGFNSTLLSTLSSAQSIVSKSFSWWFGWVGVLDSTRKDGQLVLGGYDAAKASGNNYSKALAEPSPACASGMNVIVSDMKLNFPNGTEASIMSPNSISACITPDYPMIFTFPANPYYSNFERLTGTANIGRGGGNGIDFQGPLYYPDAVYQGDLTVEIENLFSVRIPNELLVVPPANVVEDGSIQYNETVREVLLAPTDGVNVNDNAILGRHFFQNVYLNVDYDTGVFTLWNVNATTETSLVALGDCDGTHEETSNATRPTATASSSTTPARGTATANDQSHSSPANEQHASLSSGVIAGAAVGGVIGAVVLVTICALCWRRNRKGRAKDTHASMNHDAGRESPHGQNYQLSKAEAMSNDVQEMSAPHKHHELTATSRGTYWQPELPASQKPVELG